MVSQHSLHFFETFFLFLVLQPFIANSFNIESLQNIKRAKNGKSVKGLNQVKQYLKNYGYYPHDAKFTLDDRFDDSLESALKAYQKYYYLDVTGKIDSDTIKAMITPRCGHPDIIRDPASKEGPSDDNHSIFHLVSQDARRWRTYKLTYIIKNAVNVFTENKMSPSVTKAFNSWARVSPFKFAKVTRNSDINIEFFPKNHGDGNPFNPKEFAHAFLPRTKQSGKVHLNAAWNWTFNPTRSDQIDVESILVHELGHTLGLVHSDNKSAVMFAYFKPGTTKRKLTKDDIDSLKSLYGYKAALHE